jgi:hypothetical protein
MKKTITTIVLGLAVTSAFSQLNWRKGGNNGAPLGQPATIGTNASWNSPLGFVTNGVQRVQVNAV